MSPQDGAGERGAHRLTGKPIILCDFSIGF
jgi:hypothetical protein